MICSAGGLGKRYCFKIVKSDAESLIDSAAQDRPHHTMGNRECKTHYENLPMQYTVGFKIVKNENFQKKFFYIFSSPEPKAQR